MQPRKYRRAAEPMAARLGDPGGSVSPEPALTVPKIAPPPDWTLGQLLNVRNIGHEYVITLLGEEADPRKPERALRFTSYLACQNFVSRWYARTWAPEADA